MAVTITTIEQGVDASIFEVTATDNADVTAVIPHGLVDEQADKPGRGGVAGAGVVPTQYWLVPLRSSYYNSQWRVSAVDDTNLTIVKGTGAGSGNAAPQVRVVIKKPNSIGR